MEHRRISGIPTPVSVLAFGCGPGAGLMVSDDTGAQQESVAGALERGLNFFDTAAGYEAGRSETALGKALSAIGAGGEAVVLTKLQIGADELDDLQGAVRRAADASRQRLRRDVLDVLLLHNRIAPREGIDPARMPPVTVDEAVGAVTAGFEELRAAGVIRTYGFTSFRSDPTPLQEVLDRSRPDLVNVSFSPLNPSAGHPVAPIVSSDDRFDRSDNHGLIDHAASRGVGTIVIQPLAGGLLGRAGGPPVVDRLRALAAERGMSLLELAAGFGLAKDGVVALGWGFRSPAQMASAVEAVERPPLDKETVEAVLAEVRAAVPA